MSLLYFEYMKKKILREDPNISLYDLNAMTRYELESYLKALKEKNLRKDNNYFK